MNPLDRDLRIAECVEAASSLPPDQRAMLVHDRFPDDAEAVSIIMEMLQLTAREQKFERLWHELERETVALSENDKTANDAHPSCPLTLPNIPGHRLGEIIGSGGFGLVVAAFDEGFQIDVCIKLMRETLVQTDADRERFRQEARAIARLRHPNIVGVLREGTTSEGVLWFSMELIRGQQLDRLVAGSKLSAQQAAKIALDVCNALECAHQADILHRDIKPANVLIDESGNTKVVDFGLAKNLANEECLTREGHVVGTLQFMAPEQLDTKWGDVSPATDIYAVGGLIFFLLCNRSPFQASSSHNLMQSILNQPAAFSRESSAVIPRDLASICLKCLEKNPVHRYATAKDLRQDLQRFLDGLPVQARPINSAVKSYRWAKRNPMAVMIFASLLLGVLVASYFANRAIRGERIADDRADMLAVKAAEISEQVKSLEDAAEFTSQQLYGTSFREVVNSLEAGKISLAYEALVSLIPAPGQIDRRGIEWYLTWDRLHGVDMMHHGLSISTANSVNNIDVSPDGRLLAIWDRGVIRVWDIKAMQLVHTLHSEANSLYGFNHDGSMLVTKRLDYLQLLDTDRWQIHHRVRVEGIDKCVHADVGNSTNTMAFAIQLQGRLLVPGATSQVQVIDLDSGQIRFKSDELMLYARDIRFAPNDQVLAIGGMNGRSVVFDLANKTRTEYPDGFPFSFSPDGNRMAYSAGVWDINKRQQIASLGRDGDLLNFATERSIEWSPDGKRIVSAGFDGMVYEFETESWKQTAEASTPFSAIYCTQWTPNGDQLIVSGAGDRPSDKPGSSENAGGVRILDANQSYQDSSEAYIGNIPLGHEFNDQYSSSLGATEAGDVLYVGSERGLLTRYADNEAPLELAGWSKAEVTRCFAVDETHCVALDIQGNVAFVDWGQSPPLAQTVFQNALDIGVLTRPQQQLLIASDRRVIRYDLQQHQFLSEVECEFPVERIVGHDDVWVACGGNQFWVFDDTGTRQWATEIDDEFAPYQTLGVVTVRRWTQPAIADRNTLWVGTESGVVYRVSRGQMPEPRLKLTFPVAQLKLSDNGQRLVAFANANEYEIVDAITSRILHKVRKHGIIFDSLFAPDGTWKVDCIGISEYGIWPRLDRFRRPSQTSIALQMLSDAELAPEQPQFTQFLDRQLAFMGERPEVRSAAQAVARLRRKRLDEVKRQSPVLVSPSKVISIDPSTFAKLEAGDTTTLSGRLSEIATGLLRKQSATKPLDSAGLDAEALSAITDYRDLVEDGELTQDRWNSFLEHLPPDQPQQLSDQGWSQLARLDDRMLLQAHEKTISSFDLLSGKWTHVTSTPDYINQIAVDPEHQCVYVTTNGRWEANVNKLVFLQPSSLLRYEWPSWNMTRLHEVPEADLWGLLLADHGNSVIVSGRGLKGFVYDRQSNVTKTLDGLPKNATISPAKDPNHIFAFVNGDSIHHFDLSKHQELGVFPAPLLLESRRIELLNGGENVAVCYCPSTVMILNANNFEVIKRINAEIRFQPQMVADPQGKFVLVGTETGEIVQVFANPDSPTRTYRVASERIFGLVSLGQPELLCFTTKGGLWIVRLPEVGDGIPHDESVLAAGEALLATGFDRRISDPGSRFRARQEDFAGTLRQLNRLKSVNLDDAQAQRRDQLLSRLENAAPPWADFLDGLVDATPVTIVKHRSIMMQPLNDRQWIRNRLQTLELVDLASGDIENLLETSNLQFSLLAIPESGIAFIGTGGHYDETLRAFVNDEPARLIQIDLKSRKATTLGEFDAGRVEALLMMPDGKRLLGACESIGYFVCHWSDGVTHPLDTIPLHSVFGTAIDDDRIWIASKRELSIVNIATNKTEKRVPVQFNGKLRSFVSLAHGDYCGLTNQAGDIAIVEPHTGNVVKREQAKLDYFCKPSADRDGQSLWVPTLDGRLLRIFVAPERETLTYPIPKLGPISAIQVDDLGTVLLVSNTGVHVLQCKLP